MVKATINDAIRYLMKACNVSQMSMARSIGKEKPNDVSARLNNKNMTFDKAIQMLDVLGYDVTIQKRRPGKKVKGQITIVMSDAEVSTKQEFLAEIADAEGK